MGFTINEHRVGGSTYSFHGQTNPSLIKTQSEYKASQKAPVYPIISLIDIKLNSHLAHLSFLFIAHPVKNLKSYSSVINNQTIGDKSTLGI